MPGSKLLSEAQNLRGISERLELLADEHSTVTDAVLTISGAILETATVLEVLVATKLAGPHII